MSLTADSGDAAGGLSERFRGPAAAGATLVPGPRDERVGGQFPAISELALLADGEATALLAPGGNVEWMCLPRPDSPSVFATLLDRGAGRFRVGPSGVAIPASRRYEPAGMVVETSWMVRGGLLLVRDALLVGPWRDDRRSPRQQRPPRDVAAEHVLLRTMECLQGAVEVVVECEPMFDYGRTPAVWSHAGRGYGRAIARDGRGEPALELGTSLRLGIEGGRACARATLREPGRAFVALAWDGAEPPLAVEDAYRRMAATEEHWRRWVGAGRFPDHPWRAPLHRSALILKGLTYAPSGAVAAAGSTSLPRVIGGGENWDHRHAFVRDSAAALRALHALGYGWEAEDLLAFLAQQTARRRPLERLYRLAGEEVDEQTTLDHLRGYRGSRPVRTGSSVAHDAGLDCAGAVLDAAAIDARARRRVPSDVWAMARDQLDAVLAGWRRPDRGFWALEEPPRHHTSSKVMCWVAATRGGRLAQLRGRPDEERSWQALAAEIAADVLANAVSESGAFRGSYEDDELDASLLLIPLTGFLPGNDARVRATVREIGRELDCNGLILRRRPRPGTAAAGEAFTVCSWWFVAALVAVGDLERARGLAERLLSYAGALGLYGEHTDPASGRQRGNFPHAQTHLAVLDALLRVIRAEGTDAPGRAGRV